MRECREFEKSGTRDSQISQREIRNGEVARKAAAGGMVLLKNEGLLPLDPSAPLALLGGGAVRTIKGGTGSGDVNERESVGLAEGLRRAGVKLTTEGWLSDFDKRYRQAREDWRTLILGSGGEGGHAFFENYAKHTFRMPEGRELLEEDMDGAAAAVYVISRVAGEAADRTLSPGDYYLTERENADLAWLEKHQIPVCLVINTGGAIQLTEAQDSANVKAILLISQPGQAGGPAAADILLGHISPSGKLTATWPRRYEDVPGGETFGILSGDVEKEYYREGIYVGYRYYDSFGLTPLYPFGFGLSYTQFRIAGTGIRAEANGVTVSFLVENTGDRFPGREVVQLYLTCPQAGLPKEVQRLAGFRKTPELQPGETWEGEICIPSKNFASYDEERAAWTAEGGAYGIWIGNSSRQERLVGLVRIPETAVLEKTARICPMQDWLPELVRPGSVAERAAAWETKAAEEGLPEVLFRPEAEEHPVPYGDEISQEAHRLSARIPLEELIPLFYGASLRKSGMLGDAGTLVPGSAAETTSSLKESFGIPPVVLADGPAGLRVLREYHVDPETGEVLSSGPLSNMEGGFFMDRRDWTGTETRYQFCTAFPVGTLLAQSFDPELQEEVGRAVAEELEEFHVSWWLAPGMNIQRNPLCGRNFEYFSEDPLVSGLTAAAITRGVQSLPGVGTTIKHFACNNTEDNRMGSDSILSERALREIYLRGFEIAVKTAQPMCIMTSYNLVNGVHAANSTDLCTQAARREWGFEGVIMTDWTTTFPHGGSIAWQCIAAGNDLIMPGCRGDEESIRWAMENGKLTEKQVRECAARILDVILRTNAFPDAKPYSKKKK